MAYSSVAQLRDAIGTVVGVSDWITIDQQRIDLFADATDDHQWIHTDPQRAAGGPFGTTIAHGFLTLSLLPRLTATMITVDGASMGVNYGLNKVRFPAPVPVGSSLRASATLLSVDDIPGGVQVTTQVTVELRDADKPACVAESVARIYF